jgi:hypothetical protein
LGFCYIEKWLRASIKDKALLTITVLLLTITAIQLPKGLISLKAHHLPEKLAGRWILESEGKGTTILARNPIVAYYADGNFVFLPRWKLRHVVKRGRKKGVEYLAGYPSVLRERIPDFGRKEKRLLEEVRSFKGTDGERFIIYRFSPRDSGK